MASFKVRFFVQPARGAFQFGFRGVDALILNATNSHQIAFDELSDIREALIRAGLPVELGEIGSHQAVTEVTGQQLKTMGFNVEPEAM